MLEAVRFVFTSLSNNAVFFKLDWPDWIGGNVVQELVGGPMPAETSLRMTSTACLAENENILARRSSLALFNSLDQEQLSRHFTWFCGLAGRFLIVNIWVYNVSAPRDSVKCTGPGFYLHAIGLIFCTFFSLFAVSPWLLVSVLWRRAVQLVEKDLGLSHFIVNMTSCFISYIYISIFYLCTLSLAS